MSPIINVEQLTRSIDASSTYPRNLLRSEEFPYALTRYRSEMEKLQDKIFKSSDGAIVLLDLESDKQGAGYEYTEKPVKGLNGLNGLVDTSKPDPFKRFFFLRSRNSRSSLECSKRQMETILSCHQVMAPFLDHAISFQSRVNPHKFTSFAHEDYLGSQHKLPGLASLHRSGIQLQQCFNVLGVEFDEKDKDTPWKQRQVAGYHSFDLQNGRSTWIVMKGDDTIRERMQSATEESLKQCPEFPSSVAGSLRESLRDHMILLQWGTENWDRYITSLEDEYKKLSKVPEFGKIDSLANDIFVRRVKARASTMPKAEVPQTPESLPQSSEKETTAVSGISNPPPSPEVPTPGVFRRISSRFSTSSTFPLLGRYSSRIPVDTTEVENENFDLSKRVKFQGPQSLNRLATDVLTASSVIDQNKRVFSDIRVRYQELMESPLFATHFSDENERRLCEGHAADFVRKVRRLESDLESHQARLNTILYRTQQASEMYNRLFQVVNTRTAEYFATASQNSTELMQEWTEQMHQKTMSMHIITIFTLIFLPGTFVATMFSSGILTFGQEGEGGFGPWMGDWKIRPAGIKLFFAICVPLLFMTLCAWTVAYCSARVRASNRRLQQANAANHMA